MRGELRRGSPITRHATRVSAVAATGYILGTWLPLGHGYWAPLTSVMVMRPDFSQTYSRAVARLAGTVIGVAVATGVVQAATPGTLQSGTLAVASAALMYLLMRTGQFATQACIAAYVVFLLGMGGEEWTQTVPERVLLTLMGGLLAMLAYAVYPAWETPRLRTRLADWLAAQGPYVAAVFGSYADPSASNAPDVREALLTARTARAAWHAAVARATAEPVRHRGLSRTAADDAEDALAQLGRVAMLLEAHLPERGATPVPPAARFADALRESTHKGAKAIRERRVPTWDAVREALDAWETEDTDKDVRNTATLVLDTLTELSEALDTAVPPMTLDGTAPEKPNGPRNPKGPQDPRLAVGSPDGSFPPSAFVYVSSPKPSHVTFRVVESTESTIPSARSLFPSEHSSSIMRMPEVSPAVPLHTDPPVENSPASSPVTTSATALPPLVASQLPSSAPTLPLLPPEPPEPPEPPVPPPLSADPVGCRAGGGGGVVAPATVVAAATGRQDERGRQPRRRGRDPRLPARDGRRSH
jgi:hypothetical protein